jgi:serine/threonine protein phosphatase PrpC
MITCPECGLQAPDDAKFCDRCGQGLTPSAARSPAPSSRPAELAVGTVLKGEYEIAALIGQDSVENRYRAIHRTDDEEEKVRLRERVAPAAAEIAGDTTEEAETAPEPIPAAVDPKAKTTELKPPPELASQRNGGAKREDSPPAQPAEQSASPSTEPVESTDEASAASETQAVNSEAPTEPLPSQRAATQDGTVAASSEGAGQQEFIEELPEHFAEDLGDVFGRVLALSMTLTHPAFERADSGFAADGRVYLVYPDSELTSLSRRAGGIRMNEAEAAAVAVQVCQAIGFLHRRGLRLNDICPESVALARDSRVKMTGLDYVSNDNELQADPIFNDGYTAPEIYRGKKVDKRADVFSAGALLYTMLTGQRLESETWREEGGLIRFYPPHVVSPALEQIVRRAVLFNPAERYPTIDALKAELLEFAGEFKVRAAAMTDVGMVRELNEDSVLALEYFRDSKIDPAQSFLYAVCDGMGGAEAGETASAIAVTTLRDYVEDRLRRGEAQDLGKMLALALEEANLRIIEYQKEHPEARGMGSTGVAAAMVPPNAAVAWVGDSRAYLLEGGLLRQVTKDHSLVQRLVEIGQISAEEARHHEHKNVITRSLGARQSGAAGAESVAFRMRRGDKLLLCSDGLTAHVEDREIEEILRRHRDPHDAAREFIVAANAGGGTDNISVVVVFAT